MLTEELQKSLKRAYKEAFNRKHEYITQEHMLYALTFDKEACEILLNCGADITALGNDLKEFLENTIETIQNESREPEYTIGLQYTLEFAIAQAQSSEQKMVSSANILVSLFQQPESHAVFFLEKQNVTRLDIVRYISHGYSEVKIDEFSENEPGSRRSKKPTDKATEKNSASKLLDKYCVLLNERAKQGKIDPMIGRKEEIERTIHILARRKKNNPVFVGDAGVGKTAIVEGLARRIVMGEVPPSLQNHQIFALDIGGLLAGTKFRGEFEERLKGILFALTEREHSVLFIDEIHTIIGAGSISGGALDASNILKPALANGDISCIGTTTYKEYRNIFEKDHALTRRFQKIEVNEPTTEECLQILEGLKKSYEDFHSVKYSSATLKTIVELASKYLNDKFMPDKAIDILDEAGAEVKLRSQARQATKKRDIKADILMEEELKENPKISTIPHVKPGDIERLVARLAKIPPRAVHKDDTIKLGQLKDELKKVIFGQDVAIDKLTQSIQLARSGLSEEDKPTGSFLFSGPTGVGKTEISKQLASTLGIEFIRFDMSEYMEKHTVSRLVGSPPGYVGFDQGGLLTEAVHRNPHCVLLLDEIEKAHEDIYNILLQIMDHATLTDNNGRKSDFRNVIMIMTTNSGAREMQSLSIGFGGTQKLDSSMKAIENTFSPEFRNRLTAIIQFQPLEEKNIVRIIERALGLLQDRLNKKKVKLEVTKEAKIYIAKESFDQSMGARPVKRYIEEHIAHVLSQEILFGKLKKGGKAFVSLKNTTLSFEYKQ